MGRRGKISRMGQRALDLFLKTHLDVVLMGGVQNGGHQVIGGFPIIISRARWIPGQDQDA